MAKLVYILCAVLSIGCAGLLMRAYHRTSTRLLLWSALGFTGLAVANIILYLDLVIYVQVDLLLLRHLALLSGMVCILYGLIGES